MSILKTLKTISLPAVTHVISMAEQFASEHDEDIETAPPLSEHAAGHRKDGVPYAFASYYPEMIRNVREGQVIPVGHAEQKQNDVETLLSGDTLPIKERVRIAESQVRWLKYNLVKNPKQDAEILDILCHNSDESIIKACINQPNISTETLEYLVETYAKSKPAISNHAQHVLNRTVPLKMAA